MSKIIPLMTLEDELRESEKKLRAKPTVERSQGSKAKERKYNELVKQLQKRKKRLK